MMLSVAPQPGISSNLNPKPFVLLVDDDLRTLDRLQRIVQTAGHPCVVAGSPAEALYYCDANRPAVVVTDLAMPRLDGAGLARWLKARYPALPLLLVTGESIDEAERALLSATFV